MEYIITFKNANFAIKAEQCLMAKGFMLGVMPLPPQISAGCGICLRIAPGDLGAARAELAAAGVVPGGVYYREMADSRWAYTEISTCSRY